MAWYVNDITSNSYINQIVCTDGIPPDGTPLEIITTLSIYTRVYIALLGVTGIILATTCLIFIIVFRKKMYARTMIIPARYYNPFFWYRVIKLTSPNLNYVLILGVLIQTIPVFLNVYVGTTNLTFLAVRCRVGNHNIYSIYTYAFFLF